MDIEARSKAKKDQMTGKVCSNKEVTLSAFNNLPKIYKYLTDIIIN